MNGGWNAAYIMQEYQIKKAFEKKKRNKCFQNNVMKCDVCKYQSICDSSDRKD